MGIRKIKPAADCKLLEVCKSLLFSRFALSLASQKTCFSLWVCLPCRRLGGVELERRKAEMSLFEQEVIDRLARIETKLDADYRILHGNGKPGLIEDLEGLKGRVQSLEDHHKSQDKGFGKLGQIVGWLVTTAIACYAVLQHHNN